MGPNTNLSAPVIENMYKYFVYDALEEFLPKFESICPLCADVWKGRQLRFLVTGEGHRTGTSVLLTRST